MTLPPLSPRKSLLPPMSSNTVLEDLTGQADAHFKRAEALERSGRKQEAASAWLEGIGIDPTRLSAHLRLAEALYELGMLEMCMIACRQAIMVDPKCAVAYSRLGSVLELLGDRREAIDCYSKSLEFDPKSAKTRKLLASLMRADGNVGAARTLFEDLVRQHPDHAGYRFDLAGILSEIGARKEAIRELRKAVQIQPRFPEALNNLALHLRTEGELAEAERCFRSALAQSGRYAIAWNNLGNLQVERAKLKDAAHCYDRAIACSPDYAEAHTNRALLWLLEGRFADGWEEYEWRWKQPGVVPPSLLNAAWDGSSLEGKTILLYSEQGAGDTIQFVRYARLIREQGGSVVLHCQNALATLMQTMPEVETVASGKQRIPDFDVHAPLMSLPRLFGTTEATIPAAVPYLTVPPGATVPEPLREAAPGFRVGLVWAGNPDHRNDRNRSINPELLGPVLQLPGIRFFSLQVGRSLVPSGVVDLAPFLNDYSATAAALSELDLVITVDTSVAHLAGAMGRPVWVLLPVCNDWRWLQNRTDSPWYPSMKLFRQTQLGDWDTVIQRVATELANKLTRF